MQKVLVMYELKKGVTVEKYKDWLINVEMKVTPTLPGIHNFEVVEIKGSEGEVKTCTIIEDFTVDSYQVWQKAVASEAMKDVAAAWARYGDESTLKIFYGEIIE